MASKKDIVKKKKNEVIREAKIEGFDRKDPKFIAGIIILICTTVLLILSLTGLFLYLEEKNNVNNSVSDAVKFKDEYEKYNGKSNDKGTDYMTVQVAKNNIIEYASFNEVFDILDGKSGVIYFGFPECPWCRTLVPVLLDAADEAGIDTIYYLNALEERDTKSLKDGKIITDKKGTKDYYKLVDKLDSFLEPYQGLEDNSIKRLYFPTVVFVKDGKIKDIHIGTLDSQTDSKKPLSKDQHKELKDELVEKMNLVISCDDAC